MIKNFKGFNLRKPITILVGENGSGKSTLLEALAMNIGSILIGGEHLDDDADLKPAGDLGKKLKLSWRIKTRTGFFLRADDFLNYTKRLAEIKRESQEKIKEIKSRDKFSLEVLPYASTLYDLKNLYGDGLEFRSHGESFLDLFQSRFRPNGLYLLDEPEAPLSPLKQLSLISMLMEMVKENSQFIIATHSPILMALPDAEIFCLDNGEMKLVDYQEVEHVRLTKSFLEDPERYLRHL
nr:AAA family ATPase [Evansella tamaricis]